jgi:hypothetical protein
MDDLLTPEERKDALVLKANQMASVYVENLGGSKFSMKPLPVLTQVAPVNGMIAQDVNDDGNPDVVMAGNDYGNEVFAGRYDAFNGLILFGDGKGGFRAGLSAETGFYVPGDAKALVSVKGADEDIFIASQNKDSLRVFARQRPVGLTTFSPAPLDVKAELTFTNGKKQAVEFCYGSGYLSQSSRVLMIPATAKEIVVFNSKGESRKVAPIAIHN